MPFSHLIRDPRLLKSLVKLGFHKPTDIQNRAIPVILNGQDLRASAQTGTGKTAAFILPILTLLMKAKPGRGPRVLILVPTRELAQQVLVETKKHSDELPFIKTICLYGGVPYPKQNQDLSSKYDILVATPGRLIDHMERGRINFSRLEILVLDEADRMLDMGFIHPVEHIAEETPKSRQTLLFSATLPGSVINLSKKLLKNPVDIAISPECPTCKEILQKVFHTESQAHKMTLLRELLKEESIDQVLIFTATKRQAALLAKELCEEGHLAAALHGDMNQRQRTKTMQKMRQKKFKILVATDVASRGLDVLTISHVINYDLPNNSEDYVHRIGRTGRAGAKGVAISLVSRKDRPVLKEIEIFLKERLTSVNQPKQDAEKPKHQKFKSRFFPKKRFKKNYF